MTKGGGTQHIKTERALFCFVAPDMPRTTLGLADDSPDYKPKLPTLSHILPELLMQDAPAEAAAECGYRN